MAHQDSLRRNRDRSTIDRQSIMGNSEVDRVTSKSRYQISAASSKLKVSASSAFRNRASKAPATATSKHHISQVGVTILQRRDHLRVYENGEDVTPRSLVHPLFATLEDRRTAFDAIGLSQMGSTHGSHGGSVSQIPFNQQRQSLAGASSYSSIYTVDEVDSLAGSARQSLKGSIKDGADDDDDAPSQFRVPRMVSQEYYGINDKVTIRLRETETFFLFDLPQLTEDARTEAGKAVIEENERYKRIMSGAGRKTVNAETQTPQLYTKTRGTYIGRVDRKNRATFVNNWVMHDSYQKEIQIDDVEHHEKDRFKFKEVKNNLLNLDPEEQLANIISSDAYEDATRITLRILASKDYEEPQKKFAGLMKQDPCDPNLQLVYAMELLWTHKNEKTKGRPVSAFEWNPVNKSLLAVGYGAIHKSSNSEDQVSEGIVIIWCAKNPSEPDRCYEFDSPVSDLDWSRTRPNLLALGFYDGVVRVIDVSKKQLTVLKQSQRKTSPSYEPHWQVQWWMIGSSHLNPCEQLFTSNQDGRICYYSSEESFDSHQILRLQRIEGKILGVNRVNYCRGHEISISGNPGALLLRRHPNVSGIYLVGTEEGCIVRCSTAQPQQHLESYLAHDGPIYSLEFSPFCGKIILTCGADWHIRIWAEGIDVPLLVFTTRMSSVNAAAWSPRNSTIFATAVNNEICIWDIRRVTYRPASVTQVCTGEARLQCLEFTPSGEQIIAADDHGVVYVCGLTGMPLPPFDQTQTLVDALRRGLLMKPEILRRLAKIGPPFEAD